MTITKLCITNNRVTIVFILMAILMGLQAYTLFPRAEDPEFTIRHALIKTTFPGASPEKVEELVTEQIEKKIQEIPEIKHITSENRTGISIISVELKDQYDDLDPIWDDLKDKVDEAKENLPDGAEKPYVWTDFTDVFGIVLAMTGDGFSYRELSDYTDELRRQILLIPDVAEVTFYGKQEERIYIEISNARLRALGISPNQFMNILKEQNIVLPAGSLNIGPEKIVIEPTGNFETIEDIKTAIIPVSNSDILYLQDIAKIHHGYQDPPESVMHFNSQRCVGIGVNMAKGGNIVTLGKNVKNTITSFLKGTPVGLNINFVSYQPQEVIRATSNFMINLFQAILIVVLIMVLFLGSRIGIIVATLIPLTILVTFIIMNFTGIFLHRVSIAALIISLGLMVDCGIVVCEHIIVYYKEHKLNLLDAAIKTTKELVFPLLTSSLTTAIAFLPIVLAESNSGEYCLSLFQVVSIALLSSWFLSITIIPFFCYYFIEMKFKNLSKISLFASVKVRLIFMITIFSISFFIAKIPLSLVVILGILYYRKFIAPFTKGKKRVTAENRFDTRLYRLYRQFLHMAFMNKKKYILLLIGLFILSMACFGMLKQIFFPPSDRALFFVHFWMPDGININETTKEVAKFENYLKTQKSITNFTTYIGTGGPRFYLTLNPEQENENYAFCLINMNNYSDLNQLIPQVKEYLRKNSPYTNCSIRQLESASTVGYPIQIRISGEDINMLYNLSSQIKNIFSEAEGTETINDNWGTKIKKFIIEVNQSKAKRVGVTSQDIAYSLSSTADGMDFSQYRRDEDLIPIILRSREEKPKTLEELESVNVFSSSENQNVPLSQIATFKLHWEPSKIFHYDRLRTITVRCDVKKGYLSSAILSKLKPKIIQITKNWPRGYKYEIGGEAEEQNESNNDILANLPIALFLVLMLMVMQFNSFRHTFIVFSTVFMGLIGVVWALLITNVPFGFMAMLGVISLAGVVVNDAIVLLDRIKVERQEKELHFAILFSAFSHARPIILTSITTVGGLFPLAVNGGDLWRPLAITIMGGLVFSTTLTLIFVPVLFSILYKIRFENKHFENLIARINEIVITHD